MNGKKLEDYVTEQQWDMHWLDKESRRNKWASTQVEKDRSLSSLASLSKVISGWRTGTLSLFSSGCRDLALYFWPILTCSLTGVLHCCFWISHSTCSTNQRWKQGWSMTVLPRCPSSKDRLPILLAKSTRQIYPLWSIVCKAVERLRFFACLAFCPSRLRPLESKWKTI
jgi:hypothetical protein